MNIENKVVLISGGTGGIGWALTQALAEKKAKKIYVTYLSEKELDKNIEDCSTEIKFIPLDVTSREQVELLAEKCPDVDIVINNAGVELAQSFSADNTLNAAEFEMKVNYYGTHYIANSFMPALKSKSEAMLVNILSIGAFVLVNKLGTYCASKAAAHFLTKGLRLDCKDNNVIVMGVYPGYVDTDMTKKLDVIKVTPKLIADEICKGIVENSENIFPDPMSDELKDKVLWDNAIFEDLIS